MAKKFPNHPQHPERVCWGCDLYCPARDMRCGNGSDRTQHPVELFGEDWLEWGRESADKTSSAQENAFVGPAPTS
ncbi:MAG: DUF3079 domain-containing protein [Polaromonas sp.]